MLLLCVCLCCLTFAVCCSLFVAVCWRLSVGVKVGRRRCLLFVGRCLLFVVSCAVFVVR